MCALACACTCMRMHCAQRAGMRWCTTACARPVGTVCTDTSSVTVCGTELPVSVIIYYNQKSWMRATAVPRVHVPVRWRSCPNASQLQHARLHPARLQHGRPERRHAHAAAGGNGAAVHAPRTTTFSALVGPDFARALRKSSVFAPNTVQARLPDRSRTLSPIPWHSTVSRPAGHGSRPR